MGPGQLVSVLFIVSARIREWRDRESESQSMRVTIEGDSEPQRTGTQDNHSAARSKRNCSEWSAPREAFVSSIGQPQVVALREITRRAAAGHTYLITLTLCTLISIKRVQLF